jgi:RimJ/RimL family protein N-acetyltransferase
MKDLLKGRLVRLAAVDHEELSKAYAVWNQDSELTRLMDARSVRLASTKAMSAFFEKEMTDPAPTEYYFAIRALEDDRLLGDINLEVVDHWAPRNAFVGLAIGERADWSKGYGTDAMKVALRFAFHELTLRRVTLTVFEYNPRAIRSYEKSGFKHEGRIRGGLLKDGKRWDMLFMGILREDWLELNRS